MSTFVFDGTYRPTSGFVRVLLGGYKPAVRFPRSLLVSLHTISIDEGGDVCEMRACSQSTDVHDVSHARLTHDEATIHLLRLCQFNRLS